MVSLSTLSHNPCKRKWCVLKLHGDQLRVHRDVNIFKKDLEYALGFYYEKLSFDVMIHMEALWAQLDVFDDRISRKFKIFFVHPPHSKFVFATNFHKSNLKFIQEAFGTVFNCDAVQKLDIEGHDITKVAEMALQSLSQGAYASYRSFTALFDSNPLHDTASKATTKRRRVDLEQFMETDRKVQNNEIIDDKIVKVTEHRKPSQKLIIEDDPNRPHIRNVCLQTTGPLIQKGQARNPEISCFIKLEGTDVLKGLEKLYDNDMIVDGQDIPQILDANNLIQRQLRNNKNSDKESNENQRVLWFKTN